MTRSCHGLLTYLRPRGHESAALANCAQHATACRAAAGGHPAPDPACGDRVERRPGRRHRRRCRTGGRERHHVRPRTDTRRSLPARTRQTYAAAGGQRRSRRCIGRRPRHRSRPCRSATMFAKSSESLTWKRCANAASTRSGRAPARAASVGVVRDVGLPRTAATIASGEVAFRFEPSELSADTLPATALGETGESHAALARHRHHGAQHQRRLLQLKSIVHSRIPRGLPAPSLS